MLENPWPKIISYLLKREEAKQKAKGKVTKKGIASPGDVEITRKTLTRYSTGEHWVSKGKFDVVAKTFGLTPDQLGYVFAFFMMLRYGPHRFDLGLDAKGEIREPESPYDPPTARERAMALMHLDFREVPADLMPPMVLMRDKLKAAIEEREEAIRKHDANLRELAEQLLKLFDAACDVKAKWTKPA